MLHCTLALLGLRTDDVTTVSESIDRPELMLKIISNNTKNLEWLIDDIKENGKEANKVIIYCQTIKETIDVCDWLAIRLSKDGMYNGESKSANQRLFEVFTAATAESTKARVMTQFGQDSALRVVIATIAFGMGINVRDVRTVIFWTIPQTICHIWQMAGRACRDGNKGQVILIRRFSKGRNRTTKAVKDLFEDQSRCIRARILREIWLSEMGNVDSLFERLQRSTYECMQCTCCTVCASNCRCKSS